MKILTANNIVKEGQILLDVDLLLDLPNRDDDSYNQYLKTVKDDLEGKRYDEPSISCREEELLE